MHALHDPRQTTAKARRTLLTYAECVKVFKAHPPARKTANVV